jgi:adenylosuccinate lyase
VTVPNVLATRYAGGDLAAIWSPEHKIVLERRLWVAVLQAQRDLGVAVPDGVVEAYEDIVELGEKAVDLESIAARERVTRHDVKARIEEFNALAGHEHIHKGMTSRDLTENVEQLQVRQSLELLRDRTVAALARLARLAGEHETLVMAGRSHNVAAQATTLGKRFATVADELLVGLQRVEELLARYPLRGIKGPMGTSQDMLDLLDGDADLLDRLERRVAEHLGFDHVLVSVGQVYPRSLDFDVVSALVQLVAAPSNLATTIRLMAGHELVTEGFAEGQVGSAATSRWSASWPATSGTRATSRAPSYVGSPCRTRSSPPTGCSRPSSRCSTSSGPSRPSSSVSSTATCPSWPPPRC